MRWNCGIVLFKKNKKQEKTEKNAAKEPRQDKVFDKVLHFLCGKLFLNAVILKHLNVWNFSLSLCVLYVFENYFKSAPNIKKNLLKMTKKTQKSLGLMQMQFENVWKSSQRWRKWKVLLQMEFLFFFLASLKLTLIENFICKSIPNTISSILELLQHPSWKRRNNLRENKFLREGRKFLRSGNCIICNFRHNGVWRRSKVQHKTARSIENIKDKTTTFWMFWI